MTRGRSSLALAAVALICALLVAGCGSSSNDVEVAAPLDNALKYLPKDSAVLAVVPTDLDSGPIKQLDELGSSQVKGWDDLTGKIKDEVSKDANKQQIAALVGNPIAFAASGPKSDAENIAIQVQNPTELKQSFDKDIAKGDSKQLPEYQGVFIWQDVDGSSDSLNFNGLKGNMLFAADTLALLKQSIDNSGGSDNLSSNNEYKTKLNEMGDNSLLRVVGDAQQLLDNAGNSAQAEKVPFVKSLGIFTSQTTVTGDGLTGQANLATDNEDLSESEVPLPGAATLTLPTADGLAGVAVNDPDQIAKFAENTLKQVNPAGYQQYQLALSQLSAANVDLHKDLLGAMKQVSVSVTGKSSYEFRGELTDGQQFSETLTKAQPVLQAALGNAAANVSLTLEGSGSNETYVVKRDGTEVARFGVRGDTLVGSVGSSAGLPSPTKGSPIDGTGAIGIEVLLSKISSLPGLEDQINDPLAADILSSLGTATLTISETTDAITAKSQVTVGSGK
jgi:hypothetical protein